MGRLSEIRVQLHYDRLPDGRLEEVVRLFGTVDEQVYINSSEDEENCLTLQYRNDDLSTIWNKLRDVLDSSPSIGDATIIVCTGSQGWDDYKLLHHYDPAEKLDKLI